MTTALAASPDDRHVAYVHAGRIVLLDAALDEKAAVEAPPTVTSLVFTTNPAQVVAVQDGELAAYDLPSLTLAARAAVPPGSVVHAVVDSRLVLSVPGSATITVARCLGKLIDVGTFDAPQPPLHVTALEHHQALVVMPRAAEVIDLASKKVAARLNLALPPTPRVAGTTAMLRYLWAFRPGLEDLTVIRLSDGRAFGALLGGAIRRVLASQHGVWVVAATDSGARRVHVQTLAVHEMEVELDRGACVLGGAEPALVWVDSSWRMHRTTLVGDAVPASAAGGGPMRLAIEPMGMPPAARPAPSAPAPAAATSAPSNPTPPANPPPAATPRPTPAPVSMTPRVEARSLPWRLAVAEWATAVLAGNDPGAPPYEKTPLGELARRAQLSGDGARALSLLYGAWLAGQPAQPLAVVARTVEWDEVGGRGSLPHAELTRVREGRVFLRPAVARFLDGGAPTHFQMHGARARPDVAAGRQVLRAPPDIPAPACARALAERMGAAALVDEVHARTADDLAAALDEAWLRGLPVIAIAGADLDAIMLAAAPLRSDHALVIAWPDVVVPHVLEGLPEIEP